MLMGSVLSRIFVGIGVGLVVRGGGASGWDDVIALLVSKFTKLKINHVYLITDAIVLFMSLIYSIHYTSYYRSQSQVVIAIIIALVYNIFNDIWREYFEWKN